MKFRKLIELIDDQPLEEFRKDYCPLTVPHDQFFRIYALAVLLINICILLMVTFFPVMLTETPAAIINLFNIIAHAAVLISVIAYPLFFLVCNHFLKKKVYPRIRQDIRENPEMISRYKCNAPIFSVESLFIVAILLIFDAAVFSFHPAFLPYQSALYVSFLICVVFPPISAFFCSVIWEHTFMKQIRKSE